MVPLRVAVIGGGPGGMFLCHALEKMKEVVQVTCFEQHSVPGGVWRSTENQKDEGSPQMYDHLWTNGPSHGIEFYDYTFDEHFGGPVGVYLPRRDVLDYIVQRVTRHCPDFFSKYFSFETKVVNVEYKEQEQVFYVSYEQNHGKQETQIFDRCVWACGDNGKQHVPHALRDTLAPASCWRRGYRGTVLHSTETHQLERHVRGKRLLLIGGSYSAEDLALQAIKLGVDRVYISTRDEQAFVAYTSAWPDDKVKVFTNQQIGSASGKTISFERVEWTWPNGYRRCKNKRPSRVLKNIDTVIFCTGYKPNKDMLSENLRATLPCEHEFTEKNRLHVPKNWNMGDNALSTLVGDVPPGETYVYPEFIAPELWHGVLIRNPAMLYLCTYNSHFPLLATDVYAWWLASILCGKVSLPDAGDMERQNYERALHEMKIPYLRYCMDKNYCRALDKLPQGFWAEEGEEDINEKDSITFWKCQVEYDTYNYRVLAQAMVDARYPMSLGNLENLNEQGKALVQFDSLSSEHRHALDGYQEEERRTFRDYDNGNKFYSLHTKSTAVELPARWLEMQ